MNERVGPLAVNTPTVVQIKTTRAEENAYAIRMESMSANVLRKVPMKSLKLKNLDTGKALAHTKEIDKALTVKGAIGAALFGFVDGFLSGMASEFRDAFEDPNMSWRKRP